MFRSVLHQLIYDQTITENRIENQTSFNLVYDHQEVHTLVDSLIETYIGLLMSSE